MTDAIGRRRPLHRVLVNEKDCPRSLLEQYGTPLLIVNTEHDIGCAKGIYWEQSDSPTTRGMFAKTVKEYWLIANHQHSWYRGSNSSTVQPLIADLRWSNKVLSVRITPNCHSSSTN